MCNKFLSGRDYNHNMFFSWPILSLSLLSAGVYEMPVREDHSVTKEIGTLELEDRDLIDNKEPLFTIPNDLTHIFAIECNDDKNGKLMLKKVGGSRGNEWVDDLKTSAGLKSWLSPCVSFFWCGKLLFFGSWDTSRHLTSLPFVNLCHDCCPQFVIELSRALQSFFLSNTLPQSGWGAQVPLHFTSLKSVTASCLYWIVLCSREHSADVVVHWQVWIQILKRLKI